MTNDFHPGDIMNGDSSGCSSGKESVISSEESENNMSFTMDSGTEVKIQYDNQIFYVIYIIFSNRKHRVMIVLVEKIL